MLLLLTSSGRVIHERIAATIAVLMAGYEHQIAG
jgi:hypothetical protein